MDAVQAVVVLVIWLLLGVWIVTELRLRWKWLKHLERPREPRGEWYCGHCDWYIKTSEVKHTHEACGWDCEFHEAEDNHEAEKRYAETLMRNSGLPAAAKALWRFLAGKRDGKAG